MATLRPTIALTLVLLFGAAESLVAATQSFDAGLGTLPDQQGFIFLESGPLPKVAPFVQDGFLHQGETTTDGSQGWESTSLALDFGQPGISVSAEWELNVISSTLNEPDSTFRAGWLAGLWDSGQRRFEVWIGEDRFFLHAGVQSSSDKHLVDTTDTVHHYRLVVDSGVALLYFDRGPAPVLMAELNTSIVDEDPPDTTYFGDGTGLARGETLLKTFSYTNSVCVDTGDDDGDGIENGSDNCLLVDNPNQVDVDADGIGNQCDADFDNNGTVDFSDVGYMKSVFFTADPEADLIVDGIVDFLDLGRLKAMFLFPPGPSCLATSGG